VRRTVNIHIRTIEDADETSLIQDSWDPLVIKCSRNPFLLTDFVRSFSSLNKASGWNPMIVTLSDEKGLLAIVPLTVKRVYGLRLARFVLSPPYSPDFIMSSKERNSYASLAIDYIFNHLGCHILSLSFEGKSRDSRSLMNAFKELRIHYSFGSQMGHRVLPITSTWEEFERLRGSNFRRKFRKIERNLNKLGAWNVACIAGSEVGPELLDKIVEVERESWKERVRSHDTLTAVLGGLKEVTKKRSDIVWNVYFLEVEGHPIAYSLVICYAGVAYITKTSYKARYRRFYPGIYVNHVAIRTLWNTGTFTLIDFLTDLQFMETWTDLVVERCVSVMSKNPFLPLVIGFFFLNDKIKKRTGSIFSKAMERLPAFPT
jgi:CelD/BcsL family acetyltransferase involved in cellulose biosynthesis